MRISNNIYVGFYLLIRFLLSKTIKALFFRVMFWNSQQAGEGKERTEIVLSAQHIPVISILAENLHLFQLMKPTDTSLSFKSLQFTLWFTVLYSWVWTNAISVVL